MERKGTSGQVERVLKETSAWLSQHPDDNYVRAAYLGLVERKGTSGQVERVLKETSAWLSQHPDDDQVRAAYLGLVEQKGTSEQVERVLKQTMTWVDSHLGSTNVLIALIASLVRMEKADVAVIFAQKAIAAHARDTNLVVHYLRLVQDQLDEERVRKFYTALLRNCPADTNIKNAYGRWLHSHDYLDQAENILRSLVKNHPRSFQAKHSYGRLLLDMARYSEAADQFRKVLRIYQRHQMAHDGLGQALRGLSTQAEEEGCPIAAKPFLIEAEREFRQAIYWAGLQGQRQAIFYTHVGWFYIDRERWRDALEAFKKAMYEDPDFFGNYWGQGRALIGLEQFQEAENVLHVAIEKAPDDFQPPANQEIPDLLKQCQVSLGNGDQIDNTKLLPNQPIQPTCYTRG